MPNVAGVEYPYTPEGIAAAEQAERQIGKMGPVGSDIGRGGQPTFRDVSHRPERPAPAWYGGGMSGNLTGGVSGPSLQNILQLRALQEIMGQRQSQAAGIADQYQPTGLGGFGQSAAGLRPFESQPTPNLGQLIGQAIRGVPGQIGGLKQTQMLAAAFALPFPVIPAICMDHPQDRQDH